MPVEAAAVFLAATSIVAFTAALTWVNAYARGYADGIKYWHDRIPQWEANYAAHLAAQPTSEALNAQYEAWKALEQRAGHDPHRP